MEAQMRFNSKIYIQKDQETILRITETILWLTRLNYLLVKASQYRIARQSLFGIPEPFDTVELKTLLDIV